MSIEQPDLTSKAELEEVEPHLEQAEALDTALFERLAPISHMNVVKSLQGDPEKMKVQREAFEAGTIENPQFEYPYIDLTELEQKEVELLALKSEIKKDTELDPSLKRVYNLVINEKLAQNWMLVAAKTQDVKKFSRYSKFLHDTPSQEGWDTDVRELNKRIQAGLTSENETIREWATKLQGLLPNLPEPSSESQTPLLSPEFIEDARERTKADLGPMLPELEDTQLYAATEIAEAFSYALQQINASEWKVVLDPSATTINVKHDDQAVMVPTTITPMLGKSLRGLIAHEIGTHVQRNLSGSQSKVRRLQLGLDRYEQGEEGVALLRESLIKGAPIDVPEGFDGHVVNSLALGLDGTPRNFRETYTIMEALYALKEHSDGIIDPSLIGERAKKLAWDRTYRAFRGLPSGDLRGVTYTKDIIYLEGGLSLFKALAENPKLFSILGVGKFDVSNQEHLKLLSKLGVIDPDILKPDEAT